MFRYKPGCPDWRTGTHHSNDALIVLWWKLEQSLPRHETWFQKQLKIKDLQPHNTLWACRPAIFAIITNHRYTVQCLFGNSGLISPSFQLFTNRNSLLSKQKIHWDTNCIRSGKRKSIHSPPSLHTSLVHPTQWVLFTEWIQLVYQPENVFSLY